MSLRVEPPTVSPRDRGAIDNRARRRAITIDAVRAGAQHSNTLSINFFRACQGKLLIASANPAIRDLDRDFSSRDQAHSLRLFSQLAQPSQQKISRGRVIPVIATVVDDYGKAVFLRLQLARFDQRTIRQD